MSVTRNTPFKDLRLGQEGELRRLVTTSDLDLARALLGASVTIEGKPGTASARTAGALMTRLLVAQFPGPGTDILAEDYRYSGGTAVGEEVRATAKITSLDPVGGTAALECRVVTARGETLVSGTAVVRPARESREDDDGGRHAMLPRELHVFADLLALCAGLPPVPTAVVHSCDRESVLGPWQAARKGLITPIFVGPRAKVLAAAEAAEVDISAFELVDAPHSHAAAEEGVGLVRAGRAAALMKGSLHTDELMAAMVRSEAGIRTERRVSHVFVMDVPAYPRALLITDAAINIAPDLATKRDIVLNAIDLALVMGIANPRIAILSAVETVNPKSPSTLDAAALCKMADRGQIKGGLLDGPLAFDNAISEAAAQVKGIVSPVAGRADVLLAPDMEAGNMIAKQLSYLAGADSAGIVMGLRVPVALTSRSDGAQARLASCALLALVAAKLAKTVRV